MFFDFFGRSSKNSLLQVFGEKHFGGESLVGRSKRMTLLVIVVVRRSLEGALVETSSPHVFVLDA